MVKINKELSYVETDIDTALKLTNKYGYIFIRFNEETARFYFMFEDSLYNLYERACKLVDANK